jgi:hypothetical protein
MNDTSAFRILYADSDHILRAIVREILGGYGIVTCVHSEYGCMREVDGVATAGELPLGLAVFKSSLRWADLADQMPPKPEDVVKGGYTRAGERCLGYLRAAEAKTGRVETPVLLFDLGRRDVPPVGEEELRMAIRKRNPNCNDACLDLAYDAFSRILSEGNEALRRACEDAPPGRI